MQKPSFYPSVSGAARFQKRETCLVTKAFEVYRPYCTCPREKGLETLIQEAKFGAGRKEGREGGRKGKTRKKGKKGEGKAAPFSAVPMEWIYITVCKAQRQEI